MSRTSKSVVLAAVVAVLGVFAAAKLRYSGKPPLKLPAAECDPDLWKHVYEPERLRVIEACTAVEGRVVSLYSAVDGDMHIGIDPEHKSVLNLVNVMHAGSELVVEVVCDHAPPDKGAVPFCAGFTSSVTAPRIGDRVRVTGAYVTDRENGWNEIHPVTRVEVLH